MSFSTSSHVSSINDWNSFWSDEKMLFDEKWTKNCQTSIGSLVHNTHNPPPKTNDNSHEISKKEIWVDKPLYLANTISELKDKIMCFRKKVLSAAFMKTRWSSIITAHTSAETKLPIWEILHTYIYDMRNLGFLEVHYCHKKLSSNNNTSQWTLKISPTLGPKIL